MKFKFLILAVMISTGIYGADKFDNYLNYQMSKKYTSYCSKGQVEVKSTPTSFVIDTEVGKRYALIFHSTDVVNVSVFDGGFADVRKFSEYGTITFKAENKTVMFVIDGKGYTQLNWGTY